MKKEAPLSRSVQSLEPNLEGGAKIQKKIELTKHNYAIISTQVTSAITHAITHKKRLYSLP